MNMSARTGRGPSPRAVAGFTLVELMVSLVLGMIVTAAALAMFLSNRQVYQTTENLGRVHETVRSAYELMARDMREATGNACEAHLNTANVLRTPGANWWCNFDTTLQGNDGVTVESHNAPSAQFKDNTINHGLSPGDIVMVCDFDHATLLQVTNASPGINDTIVHNNGGALVPGNCSKGLGFPTDCSSALGAQYAFGPNAVIARARMHRWYVGRNSRGGRSLFEATVVNNGGVLQVARQEIAEGVDNMALQYLVAGAAGYADADAISAAQWSGPGVIAVRVLLTLSGDAANAGGDAVQRTLEHTVTLRNRVP